jgi:hypothetical protein
MSPSSIPMAFAARYRTMAQAVKKGLLASCHGIYRGGLAVHLAPGGHGR